MMPPIGGFGHMIMHGSRARRVVALTFDDGPSSPCTEEVLDVLADADVRATFFCVGTNVRNHPDLVQRMIESGHVVGNHSMRHSRKSAFLLTDTDHIDDSAAAIKATTGLYPRLYRPPWGWLTPWEARRLKKRDYTIVGWDIFTHDWKLPEVDGSLMAEKVLRKTKPGSIILFHDGCANMPTWYKHNTAAALRQIIPILRAAGYEFVTISDMLEIPAYDTQSAGFVAV